MQPAHRVNNNEKIPSYVPIYNAIYSDIVNSVYKDGDTLPSETTLTKTYGVSRHTLRQALTILNEDGLIQKRQGRGSIIRSNKKKVERSQKDFFNPMIAFAINDVETIDAQYNFAPPTEIAKRKLSVESSDILLASNNIYYSNGNIIGHSFIQIPLNRIEHLKIQFDDDQAISELMNTTIFKMTRHVNMSIRAIASDDYVNNFIKVDSTQTLIYLEEILYDADNFAIARCKFYFIPSFYEIDLWI